MAKTSKADLVGEVLLGLAYHDLDVGVGGEPLVSDYFPGGLADRQRVLAAAEEQTEQHLLLHHGIPTEDCTDIRDDWCLECTKRFLENSLGCFSEDILQAGEKSGKLEKLSTKESATNLTVEALRLLDQQRKEKMRKATEAVESRETLGPEAKEFEALVTEWNEDDDRVTDFYLGLLGRQFPSMVDRAEKLNAVCARAPVPESVRRYLIEASKCYIFGQFVACLVVCRAAIEYALGDFLERNGQGATLTELRKDRHDSLAGRIDLAQRLSRWKLSGRLDVTLAHAGQIRDRANKALHNGDNALGSDECKELFFTAREVLRGLYS